MFSLKFFVLDTKLLLHLKLALVCGNWSLTFSPSFCSYLLNLHAGSNTSSIGYVQTLRHT